MQPSVADDHITNRSSAHAARVRCLTRLVQVARLLWPRYWAGGSVFTATASMRWQCMHEPPARLEQGTPPFLEVLALKAGLEVG